MNLLEIDGVFRGLSKRDGGEFTNDKGQLVSYDTSYILKFDETVNGEIFERKLKFPVTNKELHRKLSGLDPYTKIKLICDVQLYSSNAKIIPVDLGD